jgi:hypothetical protein
MAIESYPKGEYDKPSTFQGEKLRKVYCAACRTVLCRHSLAKGFVEIQCHRCSGITVVKSKPQKA